LWKGKKKKCFDDSPKNFKREKKKKKKVNRARTKEKGWPFRRKTSLISNEKRGRRSGGRVRKGSFGDDPSGPSKTKKKKIVHLPKKEIRKS